MSRKSSTRNPVRNTVSPLLSKLLAVEAEPNPLLLQPYVALDVLHRGKGSFGVVAILGQHLIVSEQLCQAGFEQAQLGAIRLGHAALVCIDSQAEESGVWIADGKEYEALRNALLVYDRQLRVAPSANVRIAQARTVSKLTAHLPQPADPQTA